MITYILITYILYIDTYYMYIYILTHIISYVFTFCSFFVLSLLVRVCLRTRSNQEVSPTMLSFNVAINSCQQAWRSPASPFSIS